LPIIPANGTELYYVEAGSGLPCLVMHGGLGVDHTYLHPWLDPLGDVLRLIYYDHRGNGRSGRPALETLTFDQFCADADTLRSARGLDRVAVMGSSYGGFIALEYALRYPERLSHLILLGTAPAFNYGPEIIANVRRKGANAEMMAVFQTPNAADDNEMRHALNLIMPLYFHTFDPEHHPRLYENIIVSGAAGARSNQLLSGYDVTTRLGEIGVPTLILAGRDDFICPPSQATIMHANIDQAELVVFERSGHLPYAEEPETFFAVIHDWLARTRSK